MSRSESESSARPYDVIVAGHICLDIIPSMPDTGVRDIASVMRPGKLINVGRAAISTGGPVSNTGLALKKLGLNVGFMAKVGDDEFGSLIYERLGKEGSVEGVSVAAGEATSYTVAIAPRGIDRIFLHHPGTNDTFGSDSVEYSAARAAKIFHLGYPPLMKRLFDNNGEQLVEIFRRVKEQGAITSLDMSLPDPDSDSGKVPWRRILERLLPYVDMFLPSVEEAYFMMDPGEFLRLKGRLGGGEVIDHLKVKVYSELAQEFIKMGCRIVQLKAAHRGTYLKSDQLDSLGSAEINLPGNPSEWSNRELWCPGFVVKNIASATGSGDSAIAGFIAAFVHGQSPERTLKFANCLGYQNLHELDALSGIKSWSETEALVDEGALTMNPVDLSDQRWRWDDEAKVWIGPGDARFTK